MATFGLLSDLHLEFGPYDGPWPEADVLILSGDILVAAHLNAHRYITKLTPEYREKVERIVARYDAFMAEACRRYKQVVYIAGNHEHYGSNVAHTLAAIEQRYVDNRYTNLQVLEKQAIQFQDVLIFGATMWTDFNRRDAKTMSAAWAYMNDYNQIWIDDAGETRQIKPGEIYEDHLEAVRALEHYKDYAKEHGLKMVVLTHHAPSKRSTHPRYAKDWELNGSYSSDLEHLMDGIALWTHGHTHDSYDYMVGNTRIVCNPRGYWSDDMRGLNKKFNGNLVLEV